MPTNLKVFLKLKAAAMEQTHLFWYIESRYNQLSNIWNLVHDNKL